jgi:hypothetical protein
MTPTTDPAALLTRLEQAKQSRDVWELHLAEQALEHAAPELAAEVVRLRAAILDIKQNWDWWDEDRYDRCSSVVGDAIADALKGETQ